MATILIANSNEAARQQFEAALGPEEYSLIFCRDGAGVREALDRETPDLVIADVDLPGMDAFDMVRALQEAGESGAGVPLIVVHSGLPEGEQAPYTGGPGFTWMGLAAGPENLRAMVRARLASGGQTAREKTVLVVDDDTTIREALSKRMQVEGYRVLTAADGEEGLKRLEIGPDLVLLDVDMPKLDGFGFLERMRAEPGYREIPVIVMTAHARSGGEVSRGLGLGANDYVRKPFDMQELSARVQTQLRVREAHRLSVEKQRDLAIIELAGAAAHEINNPLSVIMARMELLLAQMNEDDEVRRDLEQMDDMVQRIAGVVHKMTQVRQYQVQNYCGGVNILDLDGAAGLE